MKKCRFIELIRLAFIFLAVILWFTSISWSDTAAQGPPPGRPSPPPDVPGAPGGRTQPPSGGGGAVGDRTSQGGAAYAYNPCLTVHGVVINWGYRNEPKVPINLSGPSWQTQKISDDNGYYASNCLGYGIALLNAKSPPWLRPLTSDVAIRLGYRPSFEVNLGLYGTAIAPSMEVEPILTTAAKQALPGASITYAIQVTNTLDSAMGEVMITDLLPESLTPITATSSKGDIEWWGNLLTVEAGKLRPDQTVTILITAAVRQEVAAGSTIKNRASLLYTGHVAVQTPVIAVSVGTIEPAAASTEGP